MRSKMKKIKLNSIIAALLILIVSYGCSDDFVDVKSDAVNSEDYFNSEEDFLGLTFTPPKA